ncbi:MAG: mechanosensitive ion channel domain-containing protein [Pontiella sp.]
MKYVIMFALAIGLQCAAVQAQQEEITNATAAVMFHGKELFEITNISSVSAAVRAETFLRRIKREAKSPLVSTENFKIKHDDSLKASIIMSGPEVLCVVWETDAELQNVEREALAEVWLKAIKETADQYRLDHTTDSYVKGGIFATIATIIFLFIWFVVRKLSRKEIALIEAKFSGQQMFKFVDGDSVVTINSYLIRFVRFIIMAWVFIIYLNMVLSFFPWTFNLSARLFEMVTTPIVNFGNSFVDNLPKLFALVIVCAITSFVLRSLKHLFEQIGEGKVRISGFYRDWADPTYRLVRIVVIVFAAVVAFPYIPGSSSPAFKGISIFMGVLFSLGSTSAVGNIVAGLVLTYMRPFVNDDFVEISGLRGVVVSRGTFSTRLKTPTNEIISIPNASVSANHIINFSRMAEKGGVNVGVVITLGYDLPWRQVYELLTSSAKDVPDVLENPAPKVLQLELGDFYVKYKLIVTTKHPERRVPIRSNLSQNIQDNFAAAGVEIMSPHYRANRSGEATTIPAMEIDSENEV